MRFVFKTSYDADIRWFKHGAQLFWYTLLLVAMLALPLAVIIIGRVVARCGAIWRRVRRSRAASRTTAMSPCNR